MGDIVMDCLKAVAGGCAPLIPAQRRFAIEIFFAKGGGHKTVGLIPPGRAAWQRSRATLLRLSETGVS